VSGSSQLVLFQLGARVFAAKAADVRRIATSLLERAEDGVFESALGSPWDPRRGLVVEVAGEERVLLVDGVLGLRVVPDADLCGLPAFAREVLPTSALRGFAMLDEVATLVIDLPTLVKEGLPAQAAVPREENPRHA